MPNQHNSFSKEYRLLTPSGNYTIVPWLNSKTPAKRRQHPEDYGALRASSSCALAWN
jgi:hypothetical protein